MDKPKKEELSPISRRAFFGKMAKRAGVAGAVGLAASQLAGCPIAYTDLLYRDGSH